MFWKYGFRAVECWAVESKAGRLRISGAILLVMIAQVILLPAELARVSGRIWKASR